MLKLPPFAALRAFEAVSRLGSVTRAGLELHLTHSAVSHQVKSLEDYLKLKLLERDGRRIKLTSEGRSYAYHIRQSLLQIGTVSERVSQRQRSEHITIGLLPSFGAHWLVPRLGHFLQEHPNWHVELLASLEILDFDESPVDCSIRFGHGDAEGAQKMNIMQEWLVLVASPQDTRFSPTQNPADAVQAGPIFLTNEGWASWVGAAGMDVELPPQPMQFNDSNLALEAARNGLGAVLTRWSIAEHWIASGLLQRVCPVLAPHDAGYKLVWPDRSHQSNKIAVFSKWLQQQCAQFEQQTLGMVAGMGTGTW